MRAVRRAAALVVVIAAAIGMAWGMGWIRQDQVTTQSLPSQAFGPDAAGYRNVYIEPAAIVDGRRLFKGRDAKLMAFDSKGKIGLCGFVMAPTEEAQDIVAWLAQARVAVNGRRVTAGFIKVVTPDDKPQADCIATSIDWPGDPTTIQIDITGTPLVREK